MIGVGICLAASGTKAVEIDPGFPQPARQPQAQPKRCCESHPACTGLLVFQKNFRLSLVNLNFLASCLLFSAIFHRPQEKQSVGSSAIPVPVKR